MSVTRCSIRVLLVTQICHICIWTETNGLVYKLQAQMTAFREERTKYEMARDFNDILAKGDVELRNRITVNWYPN